MTQGCAMAISYSLAVNPKWYIADLVGRPLAGGYLATFSSQDHTLLKPVYQDSGGTLIWPYETIPNVGSLGILFDENGSQGPFYFKFDTDFASQLYYLEVYDSVGVLQWTINNFSPATNGGGAIITTGLNLNNLVTNNIMLRNNVGYTPISAINMLNIAPGAHSGLSTTPANASPDIHFYKNGTGAVDTINFLKFAQGEKFPNGEPTPINYLHYFCSVAGTGETVKCVQFPITHGVQNIQDQGVTISIFAKCSAGDAHLTINWMQFFGDGPSASSPAVLVAPLQTFSLTSAWQKLTINPPGANVPDTTGKVIGECGNDGLFLQIQYPLDAAATIDFTKPSVYMGNIIPEVDYTPNDAIESVMNNPRTGSVLQTYDATSVFGGYVEMNDGTIGTDGSGATNLGSVETFPLYNLLYQNVTIPSANTLCIVSGYTGNAINDFVAARTMQLPKALGRAFATFGTGAGLTARVLGSVTGAESHVVSLNEIPDHTHNSTGGAFVLNQNTGGPFTLGGSGGTNGTTAGITSYSGQTALSLMQPTTFINTLLKL